MMSDDMYVVPVLVLVAVPHDQAADEGDAENRAVRSIAEVLHEHGGPEIAVAPAGSRTSGMCASTITTVGRALRDGKLRMGVGR